MSLIKAYYITRASNEAGYTYDGTDFTPIAGIPTALPNANGCVGVDPNNGNKVIFAGTDGSNVYIVTSDDHGETLDIPGGDWYTFDIGCDSGSGARIIVLDSLISYIYGTDGVYKSIDGGLNYNIVNSTLSSLVVSPANFVKIHMSDEFNGILGLSNVSVSNYVKLFRTSDGCVTWTPIIGFDSLNSTDQICGVYISPNGNTMVVVGKSTIYRSTDSGTTWNIVTSFSNINTSLYGAALDVVNENVMYALGGNNTVYKTTDAGATWTIQSSDGSVSNSHLFSFYSETEGYTSRTITGQDVILRTLDSGVTWTQVDIADSTPLDLQSVFYNCGECPDDFTKTALDECQGKSLGPDLCPKGFTFDVLTNTCTGSGECPPTEIVFVLDIGASVVPDEKLQMQAFLQAIVDAENVQQALSAGTLKLGFCTFAGTTVGLGNSLNLTSNPISINNYITNFANLTLAGGTNTSAGLEKGTQILYGQNSNINSGKKIILVTDGWPASLQPSNTSDTFVISNNDGLSQTWTVTNDLTPPCGRANALGNPTDCTRCDIYNTAMEIADYIKNTLGAELTLAILTGQTPDNLNNILLPAQNPGNAPTVEAYITHRALVTGYLDQMTHMFPPSQDPTSPWYIGDDGYKPPFPIAGGHLSQIGFTNQDTGISFGRLVYGPQSGPSTRMGSYSSNSSQTWPSLPAIYGTQTTPSISVTNSTFDPYGLWDCNLPGDPPNPYAPMCGFKTDGSLDLYVSSFAEAAENLAPQIAEGICSNTISVECPEGCTSVQSGTNGRCECEKTLFIVPCIYNVYDCADLTTPVYCTQEDLGAYVGPDIIVRIAVDGPEVPGCYQIGTSDIDYCDPLDQSIVTVTQSYTSCAECQPNFVRLTSCNNEEIYLQIISDYLINNIGKAIELLEYPGLCWRVDLEPTFPTVTATVNIKQIYDDCACCKQYSCNP